MTTPAALRELADRLAAVVGHCHPETVDMEIADIATQLRTAASEGGSDPFAHLVMTEWNSIAWWTTESAERAQQEADELMRYDSKRKLTVVTVYTQPPEVARDAARELLSSLNYLIGELCNESGTAQVDGNVEREKALDWATDRLREIADAATSDAALRARAVGK